MSVPRTRASRLPEARRDEILATVVDLVGRNGYDATTVEGIAEATATSKATLYRHWVDKPTLVVTALTHTSQIDFATIDTGAFDSDLHQLVDMLARRARHNIPLVLTLAEASRHDARLRAVFERSVLPELNSLQAIVQRAESRGELVHPARAAYLREILLGALFGSVLFGGTADHVDAAYLRRVVDEVVLPLLIGPRPE